MGSYACTTVLPVRTIVQCSHRTAVSCHSYNISWHPKSCHDGCVMSMYDMVEYLHSRSVVEFCVVHLLDPNIQSAVIARDAASAS